MSMNGDTDVLLQSGIAAVRSGDKREGARLLAQVVRKEPQSEDAWFWLAAATDQPAEAAACLRRVLAINPNNARARQALNMLDTGQGQAAFSTGPLDVEQSAEPGNRPLSTGDLVQPYSSTPPPPPPVPAPPPPPPPFNLSNPYGDDEPTISQSNPYGTGPLNVNPYGTEPTVTQPNPYGDAPTVPSAPPPFAWNPNNQNQGEMPADPYSTNPAQTQPNLPPPPPFIGGSGVRLGQLDPNAPPVVNNPNIAGPNVFDPGAELRASLLPPTPVNAVPPPPGQVVVVKKKRRLSPLLMVLIAIIVLLLAGLIAFLLLRPAPTPTVAEVPVDGQTATAAVNLTATSTAQGTPGAVGNGTVGANGTPGVNGTAGAGNGTAGVNGTAGAGNGTPGVNGTAANGTPGTGGATGNGTAGANGTAGVGPNGNGTVQPGQPTPTAQSGQPGTTNGTGTNTTPGPTATGGAGANGGTPGAGTPGAGTPTLAVGMGTDVPPPTVRDNRPPPEVVDYVNNTAKFINTAQFFEAAIAEGLVKPYRAGRIKPGVTLININPVAIPSSAISTIAPSGNLSATNGTTPRATNPTATPNPAATLSSGNPSGAPNGTVVPDEGVVLPTNGPTVGTTTTPQVSATAQPTVAGNNVVQPTPTLPANARKVIINGPNGPEEAFLVDFSGKAEMAKLTLSLGQVARVLKDQAIPAGAFDLNQVSLEYANDLSNMANAMDMFFQSGKISYLEDLANYYDKAVRDRDHWATIVNNGYPFHIIL